MSHPSCSTRPSLSALVALCKAYVKCEQRIPACPWNAVPEQVMHNLKCIGMRVELPHLETLAVAAQVRLVASLPCFWGLHSQACSALDSGDCILRFLGGGWPCVFLFSDLLRLGGLHIRFVESLRPWLVRSRRQFRGWSMSHLGVSCPCPSLRSSSTRGWRNFLVGLDLSAWLCL